MFPHRNVHKYIWTSPDEKTHNQVDHIIIDRRWRSNILDIRIFRGTDCDNDHCLLFAKVRQKLTVNKEEAQRFDGESFNLRKLKSWRLGRSIS